MVYIIHIHLDNKHFKYLKYDLYVKKIEELWRA